MFFISLWWSWKLVPITFRTFLHPNPSPHLSTISSLPNERGKPPPHIPINIKIGILMSVAQSKSHLKLSKVHLTIPLHAMLTEALDVARTHQRQLETAVNQDNQNWNNRGDSTVQGRDVGAPFEVQFDWCAEEVYLVPVTVVLFHGFCSNINW
jgi:hypothetical protein